MLICCLLLNKTFRLTWSNQKDYCYKVSDSYISEALQVLEWYRISWKGLPYFYPCYSELKYFIVSQIYYFSYYKFLFGHFHKINFLQILTFWLKSFLYFYFYFRLSKNSLASSFVTNWKHIDIQFDDLSNENNIECEWNFPFIWHHDKKMISPLSLIFLQFWELNISIYFYQKACRVFKCRSLFCFWSKQQTWTFNSHFNLSSSKWISPIITESYYPSHFTNFLSFVAEQYSIFSLSYFLSPIDVLL